MSNTVRYVVYTVGILAGLVGLGFLALFAVLSTTQL
jgi:hypothetical protein